MWPFTSAEQEPPANMTPAEKQREATRPKRKRPTLGTGLAEGAAKALGGRQRQLEEQMRAAGA